MVPRSVQDDVGDREYVIRSQGEKWQFVCPRSADREEQHHDWRVWDGVFSCRTCKQNRHSDPGEESVYEYLVDKVSGERVYRDQLVIEEKV